MYSKFRIELSGLTLEPLLLASFESEEKSWSCFIDIGGGNNRFSYFKDGLFVIQR
jgi:hypothetical protein